MARLFDDSQIMKAMIEAHGEPVFITDDTLHIRCMVCGAAFAVPILPTGYGTSTDTVVDNTGLSYTVRGEHTRLEVDFRAYARHDDCPGATITIPQED